MRLPSKSPRWWNPLILNHASHDSQLVATFVLARNGDSIYVARSSSWGLTFLALALCSNMVGTTLIAFRIWSATRGLGRQYTRQYWRVIFILVESAAIAALGQLIELSFYAAKFPGNYFMSDMMTQIVVRPAWYTRIWKESHTLIDRPWHRWSL